MAGRQEEDLSEETTEGFKVGEKKTIDEYQKLGIFLGPTSAETFSDS